MQHRPAPPVQTLVVAGRSARLMVEAAAGDGYRVIALDTYGDQDTRRAAARWLPIGEPGQPIDARRTLEALTSLRDEPQLVGLVAGSDFECDPALLAQAAERLPLLGTAPDAVARVRDPAVFFSTLDELGLPHPAVSPTPPADPQGWLRKLAQGSGGWHIRRAGDGAPNADDAAPAARRPGPAWPRYYQREMPGQPMSALFIGNGQHARLIGINELIVRPLGALPHVYRGAVGPVMLPFERLAEINAALDLLTARFSLRGLASLDFLLDDSGCALLEINPRPSASVALYSGLWPLMHAHVDACQHDHLPLLADHHPGTVRGNELLLARRAFTLSEEQAALLAARKDCHDLPVAGSRFGVGDPVCTLSASGPSVAAVRERLAGLRQAWRERLAAAHPITARPTVPVPLAETVPPAPPESLP